MKEMRFDSKAYALHGHEQEVAQGIGVGSALGQPVTPIRQVISKLTDLMRKVESLKSLEIQDELSDIINDLGKISKSR
jgi:hypothetical protein